MDTLEKWANFTQILSLPISILGLVLSIVIWKYPPTVLTTTRVRQLQRALTYIGVAGLFFWLGTLVPTFSTSNATLASQEELAVRRVIDTDINIITGQNLPLVDSIYAANASIVDCQGTISDASDDNVFVGIEGIRERYRTTITWGWRSFTLIDLTVKVEGNTATASHQGLVVNREEFFKHPAVYKLVKSGNQWLITELRIRCTE